MAEAERIYRVWVASNPDAEPRLHRRYLSRSGAHYAVRALRADGVVAWSESSDPITWPGATPRQRTRTPTIQPEERYL